MGILRSEPTAGVNSPIVNTSSPTPIRFSSINSFVRKCAGALTDMTSDSALSKHGITATSTLWSDGCRYQELRYLQSCREEVRRLRGWHQVQRAPWRHAGWYPLPPVRITSMKPHALARRALVSPG